MKTNCLKMRYKVFWDAEQSVSSGGTKCFDILNRVFQAEVQDVLIYWTECFKRKYKVFWYTEQSVSGSGTLCFLCCYENLWLCRKQNMAMSKKKVIVDKLGSWEYNSTTRSWLGQFILNLKQTFDSGITDYL